MDITSLWSIPVSWIFKTRTINSTFVETQQNALIQYNETDLQTPFISGANSHLYEMKPYMQSVFCDLYYCIQLLHFVLFF
jgi:hypothetical protein